MDYYYKYLKYKNKYLELKGGKKTSQKRKIKIANEIVAELLDEKPTYILFMFLGGLPLINDHWKRFLETSNKKLIIVVHPMVLEGFIDKINASFWKSKYDKGELLVVDPAHHVKTAWATKSLTDAQLLMMQYALIKKGRIFKKYVLISSNDSPLYNFNVMYKELNLDSKSWFSFFAKVLIRQNWKKLYKHEGGIFDFDDIDVASQWSAIDDSHIEFYFDPKKIAENKPTYSKIETDITVCYNIPINIIKAIPGTDIKYQQYLDATNGYGSNKLSKKDLEDINEKGLCTVTDGLFFNAILKHELKLRKLKLIDNIKYNEIAYLNDTNNHKEYIKPKDWEGEYLTGGEKHAFIDNNLWNEFATNFKGVFGGESSDMNRIWYGSNVTFNTDRLLLNFIENRNYVIGSPTEKKWFIFENGEIKSYSDEEKNRKITIFCNSIKNKYKDIDRASELYFISSTYTDFSLVSLDPNNVFRSFNHTKFIKDFSDDKIINLFSQKSINNILKDDPTDNINNLMLKKNQLNIEIISPTEEFIINLKRHPIEYSRWNLTQIINAYNFLIFFEINEERLEPDYLDGVNCSFISNIERYINSRKAVLNDVITNRSLLVEEIFNFFKNSYTLFHNILKFKLNILGLTDDFYSNRPSKSVKGKYAILKAQHYYKRMINLNKLYIDECCVIDKNGKDKIYYIFKDNVSEVIKNENNYGIPMTSFFLNNALTNGSLFIRKVGDNSRIEEFTDELFGLDEYTLNSKKKYKQRPLIAKELIPYVFRTEENNTIKEKEKIVKKINELIEIGSKDIFIIYFLKLNEWDWKKARDSYREKRIGPFTRRPSQQHIICKKVV